MPDYRSSPNPTVFNARLMGRVEGCTNPESCDLLPDGETFVFGNCTLMVGHPAYRAGQGIVYLDKQAFISRGRIGFEGEVALTDRQLITGLTATLGLDVLRRGTASFPAGTVFICEGANPTTRPGEQVLVDVTRLRPRAFAFDPIAGKAIGEIGLHSDSPIGRAFNAFDQPNGMAIDGHGNLYVGDIPNGNPDAPLPPPTPPGVYRIPHEALDALAAGDDAAARSVRRLDMEGFVNGLAASPIEDVVWAVSCHPGHDPVNGGLYRLTPDDFERNRLPPPVLRDLGILDGVGVTRRGTLLVSTPVTGDVHAFTADGRHLLVRVEGENVVRMPADFNVCHPKALHGEPALLVTDISVGFSPGDASVAVIEISGL
jgi:hypothetical protein